MKPRRLHSATILSIVTASVIVAGMVLDARRRRQSTRFSTRVDKCFVDCLTKTKNCGFLRAMHGTQTQVERISMWGTVHGAPTGHRPVGRGLFERRYPYLSGGARTDLGPGAPRRSMYDGPPPPQQG